MVDTVATAPASSEEATCTWSEGNFDGCVSQFGCEVCEDARRTFTDEVWADFDRERAREVVLLRWLNEARLYLLDQDLDGPLYGVYSGTGKMRMVMARRAILLRYFTNAEEWDAMAAGVDMPEDIDLNATFEKLDRQVEVETARQRAERLELQRIDRAEFDSYMNGLAEGKRRPDDPEF